MYLIGTLGTIRYMLTFTCTSVDTGGFGGSIPRYLVIYYKYIPSVSTGISLAKYSIEYF